MLGKYAPKNKYNVRNVIYSFLVFIASCDLLVEFLDPKALTHPSVRERNPGAFIGLGIQYRDNYRVFSLVR